jgi:hypothetical protein
VAEKSSKTVTKYTSQSTHISLVRRLMNYPRRILLREVNPHFLRNLTPYIHTQTNTHSRYIMWSVTERLRLHRPPTSVHSIYSTFKYILFMLQSTLLRSLSLLRGRAEGQRQKVEAQSSGHCCRNFNIRWPTLSSISSAQRTSKCEYSSNLI